MNSQEALYRSALMTTKSGDRTVLPLSGTPDKNYPNRTGPSAGGPYAHIWEMGYNDTEISHTMDSIPVRKDSRNCERSVSSNYCSNQQQPVGDKVIRPIPDSYLRTVARDHLYESPQMKRRAEEEAVCAANCPVPFYHEFDPTSTASGCDGCPVLEVTHWSGGVDGIVPGRRSTVSKD